jgi:hypothetical protein
MVFGLRSRIRLETFIRTLILFCVVASLVSVSHASEIDTIRMAIGAKGARWVAGENPISLLPEEERVKRLGLIKPVGLDLPVQPLLSLPVGLPSSLDWRNYNGDNYITPVRDQGNCGSCWAFSTTAALESYALLSSGIPGINLDLAEQVLLSCSGAGSCNGGYPGAASDFIRDTGLPLETCYHYTETNGKCSNACPSWQSSAYTIPSWRYVATSSPTVNALKAGLFTYGPLSTTMVVYTDFFSYYSGVYSYTYGTREGGHAVLLVGYDDAKQCFIVKNSWGTGWGESGYFRIAYSELGSIVEFGEYSIAYGTGVPDDPENVSIPTELSGPDGGVPETPYTYMVGGAASSLGHDIEYLIDWGDGSDSGWLPVGTITASTSWNATDTYIVRTKARCAADPSVESDWSWSLNVTISAVPYTAVTLLAPLGGEAIPSGETYRIQWEAPPDAVKFKVMYSPDGGTTWNVLAKDLPLKYYDWNVPTPAGNIKPCLVKVVGLTTTGKTVSSDRSRPFTIEVIRVNSPNGGETLDPGRTKVITWTAHGTKRDVAKVKIFYTLNSGATWNLIHGLDGNPGSYLWAIPPVTSNKAKVKVVLKDFQGRTVGSDLSDHVFSIRASP